MLETNNNQFEVEVMYFEEWNLCKILKIIDQNQEMIHVDFDTTLAIEDGIGEQDLLSSELFLDFIRQKYGITDNDTVVVTHGIEDDEEEESTGGCLLIEIYTIEDSFNFKLLRVTVPGTESTPRENIAFDKDKIFVHPNENIYFLPLELFEYLENLSGFNLDEIRVCYNYDISGCRKAPDGEATLIIKTALKSLSK